MLWWFFPLDYIRIGIGIDNNPDAIKRWKALFAYVMGFPKSNPTEKWLNQIKRNEGRPSNLPIQGTHKLTWYTFNERPGFFLDDKSSIMVVDLHICQVE